jgi:hypothetical protein
MSAFSRQMAGARADRHKPILDVKATMSPLTVVTFTLCEVVMSMRLTFQLDSVDGFLVAVGIQVEGCTNSVL